MTDVVWEIFEVLVTAAEGTAAVYFVLAFQEAELKSRAGRLMFLCGVLAYTGLVLVINYITDFEGVLGAVYIVLFFLLSLAADSKIYMKLLASALAVLVSLATASIVFNIISAAFRQPLETVYSERTWLRFAAVLTVQFLKVFEYNVILKISNSGKFDIGKKEWALILSVFGISFVMIALIQTAAVGTDSGPYSLLLLGAELCAVIITPVCFYMTVTLSRSRKETEELRLMSQRGEFQRQYAQNVKNQYEETRRIKHDMKQFDSLVLKLLSEGKTEEAAAFIRKNSSALFGMDTLIDAGGDFISAILNTKLSAAKQRGVEVICSVDKGISAIDETDLCCLLGNMLDNALEACEKCESGNRFIEVRIKTFNGQYLIEVSNTVAENVLEENAALVTTKPDSRLHGFGTESVRAVAEKYGGTVSWTQEGKIFTCDVLLLK